MPSWSPDGTSVYFIRTTDAQGLWPAQGVDRHYKESVPAIMRVDATGGGAPEQVLTGTIHVGQLGRGSRGCASPCCRPTATRSPWSPMAPTRQGAMSCCSSTTSRRRSEPSRRRRSWPRSATRTRPGEADGKFLLYVRNGRDAARGAPEIFRWDVAKKKASQLTGPGYLEPSYSPDGVYIAATRTTSFGNDVVILDAAHGRELLRVTTDGASWAPVWSPAGDAIAFLHLDGQIVDLKLARLGGPGPDWTVTDTIDLTQVSGLDGGSRPDWYIPPDEMPATPATDRWPPAPARARRQMGRWRRDDDLPRSTGGPVRGCRQRPVPRPRPRSGVSSRRASRPTCAGSSGSPVSWPTPRRRSRPRSSRTSRSSRRSGRMAWRCWSGSVRACRPTCRSSSTASVATSAAPSPVRPWPCSTSSARTPSRSTRTSGARRSCRCSAARTGSRTCCAGRRTPAPGSSRASSSRPTRTSTHPPSRSTCGSPAGLARGGRAAPSAWWLRRRHPPSSPRSARRRPGLPFLVPGIGAQGGQIDPVLAHGPATADPGGGRPGRGLIVNVSRAIVDAATRGAPNRRLRRLSASVWRPPPPTGPADSLCYPSPRKRTRGAPQARTRAGRPSFRSNQRPCLPPDLSSWSSSS